MQEFSFYTVRNQIGEVVATGHKEGFCLVNMSCRDGNFPDVSAYPSCSILSAGCADIYSSGIGCQYVDITDLPPGNYLLDVTLNKNRVMAETDFSNNTSLVPFEICAQNKAQSGDFTLRYPKKTGQDRKFSLTTRSRIIDAKRKFNPLKDQLTLELFQNTDSLYSPSATIILPPGLPGSGCDPRDGWQKIETGHWRYRSYSGSTSPSCYASGITLSSVELKRLSKRSPRYRITWTGKMNPTVLPGRTSTLRAFVSLNGTTSNSNETCTSPVTLDSCTLKEPKSQPTLHCK